MIEAVQHLPKNLQLDNIQSDIDTTKTHTPFFIKLFNWEYWNSNIINAPIFFYWAYLSIRAKSLFFFNASNPTIENGGFVMEKKSGIYDQMPQAYYPKTLLVNVDLSTSKIRNLIESKSFNFPAIVKPDIGGKGRGVKKVEDIEEAIAYIKFANFPMLVQELVTYKYEAGIFYYRYPWEDTGTISGIVSKDFVSVLGDGKSTVEQLLLQNPRYVLQMDALRKMQEINLAEIIISGEEKVLVAFGNHARGAKFIDDSNKITPKLIQKIDAICKQVPEFYFGRLDVMYKNWNDLENGENLSIIELNGAGSEPTHIYDPSHSIFFAWKEIAKHLKIMWRISMYNHKVKNIPFIDFKTGMQMFKDLKRVEARLDELT